MEGAEVVCDDRRGGGEGGGEGKEEGRLQVADSLKGMTNRNKGRDEEGALSVLSCFSLSFMAALPKNK